MLGEEYTHKKFIFLSMALQLSIVYVYSATYIFVVCQSVIRHLAIFQPTGSIC